MLCKLNSLCKFILNLFWTMNITNMLLLIINGVSLFLRRYIKQTFCCTGKCRGFFTPSLIFSIKPSDKQCKNKVPLTLIVFNQ